MNVNKITAGGIRVEVHMSIINNYIQIDSCIYRECWALVETTLLCTMHAVHP